MKDKQYYLSHFLWLQCLLSEATEVIDELQGSHLYKHRLKQALKGAEKQIEEMFRRDELNQFYKEGGADGLVGVTTLLEKMRNEIVEGVRDEA